MLPFRNKSQSVPTLQVIEDGFGNSIEVPRYGYLTPNEKIDTYEKQVEFSRATSFNPAKLTLEVVAVFLSYRFARLVKGKEEIIVPLCQKDSHLSEGWKSLEFKPTPEEISEAAGSQAMIEKLYEFFQGEERGWIESDVLLELRGKNAKEIAIEFAESHPDSVVAATPAMQQFNSWQVFSSVEKVPPGYETAMGES